MQTVENNHRRPTLIASLSGVWARHTRRGQGRPFDPARRDLRMNRPAGRFTSSAPTSGNTNFKGKDAQARFPVPRVQRGRRQSGDWRSQERRATLGGSCVAEGSRTLARALFGLHSPGGATGSWSGNFPLPVMAAMICRPWNRPFSMKMCEVSLPPITTPAR
jgi:hypothetical protein